MKRVMFYDVLLLLAQRATKMWHERKDIKKFQNKIKALQQVFG